VTSLDINQDGEIDLWEFCIAIQRRHEGISFADVEAEIDAAFQLWGNGDGLVGQLALQKWAHGEIAEGNDDVTVGQAELHEVMCGSGGSVLSEEEFADMLADMDRRGMSVSSGKRVRLAELRKHPSFRD